jgi:hypothetical protein
MARDVMKNLFETQARNDAAAKAARAKAKAAPKQTRSTSTQAKAAGAKKAAQSVPTTRSVATRSVGSGVGGLGGLASGFAADHDLGPWIEAPQSSRVKEYRYDYGNGQLQVKWANDRGHMPGTIYQLGDEETGAGGSGTYRSFAQAVSKGKYVNRVLNNIAYWPGDDASFTAPSNPNRGTVRHKP